MRRCIRRLDVWLRALEGVFEFTSSPAGIFRVQITRARKPVRVGEVAISPGQEILDLHLWNEHVPQIPASGADLAWAASMQRRVLESLRDLARVMQRESRYRDVRMVRALTVLVGAGEESGTRFALRLGFQVAPYRGALGRFGDFWENFYTWWLMWAYNPASVRRRSLVGLRRGVMWMETGEFLRRFGDPDSPPG